MTETAPEAPRHAGAIRRVREGDAGAFGDLVRDFQDMAVGYAFSILGDFHLAEDAAQEAFLDAFRHLDGLREPLAFPGWLRRIVFKHCDRLTRGERPATVPVEEADGARAPEAGPLEGIERSEMRERLASALDDLPERSRSVLVLHYMTGHSLREVAAFLDEPEPRVKKRLHDARLKLRAIVEEGIEDRLRSRRPSRGPEFARSVVDLLEAARRGDATAVRSLLASNPRLREGRDFMGNTALILAAACGHRELAALLLESGAPVDVHEAAAIGATRRVAAILDADPGSIDRFSDHGFTPLALAAHFGHLETARLLLDRGCAIDVVSRHPVGVTPLHAALFGRRIETAALLVERGADVGARRGGKGWPRAGWTALHYAASGGLASLIPALLARGADPSAADDAGETPLGVARRSGDATAVRLLQKGGMAR